jgi:hypothetical protein
MKVGLGLLKGLNEKSITLCLLTHFCSSRRPRLPHGRGPLLEVAAVELRAAGGVLA